MKTITQLEQLKTQKKNLEGIVSEAKMISEEILKDLFIYTIKENMHKDKAVHPNVVAEFCDWLNNFDQEIRGTHPSNQFNFYYYDFQTFHGWSRDLNGPFYVADERSAFRGSFKYGPSVSSYSRDSFVYDCEKSGSARAIGMLNERILMTQMMVLDWDEIGKEFVELISTVSIEGIEFYIEAEGRLDTLNQNINILQKEVADYEMAVIMETIKACDVESIHEGKVQTDRDLYWADTDELKTEDMDYTGKNDVLTKKFADTLRLYYNQQDYGYADSHGFRILRETPKGFVIACGTRPWAVTGKNEESQTGDVVYSEGGFRVHKDYFNSFINNLGLLQTLRGEDE